MKTIKAIKIDTDKCCGCKACEVICSTVHSTPKYSTTNPERARIRVFFDPFRNISYPMMAGPYTEAECNGRYIYTLDGKEYDECSFCRASCPSRPLFREPDTGLPLKCDMCESEPEGPWCVRWCLPHALIYEEREEEE
ncbi:(4Fe-4S)-binding protein [Chloroflexota bacterium]